MDSPLTSNSPNVARSSFTGPAPLASGLSLDSAFDYDEHLIDLDELERRLSTSRATGLSASVVHQQQHGLNVLPTDAEAGHGAIHELVAVLRDGAWLHMRAENLLPGDVISLQPDQCVPADVRVIESDDMRVSQRAVNGTGVGLATGFSTLHALTIYFVPLPQGKPNRSLDRLRRPMRPCSATVAHASPTWTRSTLVSTAAPSREAAARPSCCAPVRPPDPLFDDASSTSDG